MSIYSTALVSYFQVIVHQHKTDNSTKMKSDRGPGGHKHPRMQGLFH